MLGDGPADIRNATTASWRSGRLPVSDGHLAYHRTGGEGPKLVLSHGLTDNGLCWFRFAAALAADFDIIMLDARGHGDSARIFPDQPHDPAADIAEAIAQLNLEKPIVMGHSVGARATARYANAHPDRVSKVILEDPPLLPPLDPLQLATRREAFRRQVEKFQSMSLAEISAMGRASSPLWHDDDFPAWAAAKKQVDPEAFPAYGAPWQEEIACITAPTLLVRGEAAHGSLVPLEQAEQAHAINPNIRSVEISGAGHNVRRENFPEFLSVVRAFLLSRPR